MCVLNEVCFFGYGLYVLCAACMTLANYFARTFAIALLFMPRKENMQNKHNGICVLMRFDVSNIDCICFV